MSRDELVEIELGDIESVRQLHERMMTQLKFPHWYGKNWNAFWDAITGLVEMPLVLRLKNWIEFERRFPHDAMLMNDCLQDMERKYPRDASSVERI
ncbi:ribonuclease inhibitor [Burkholderia multivorans]|uniref:barstar family protein n=1 Tax=Burkholderia ubonensis TaxID=101571 RepID=UPI000F702C2C|nr:barstar family protein [Burkholderia ubonensis]AYZ64277.1 ribonuclease inhibitor [Burkholderia multivorans]VWB37387.1 Barstar [Burkholderia ubonensis]